VLLSTGVLLLAGGLLFWGLAKRMAARAGRSNRPAPRLPPVSEATMVLYFRLQGVLIVIFGLLTIWLASRR
jgi:hypothetical protein